MTPTRVDLTLVKRGLVESRTKAKRLIDSGSVAINGVVVTKPSAPVGPGDDLVVTDHSRDVGRGAIKLRAALEAWPIPVGGALCADVGASTGGFTQVLLASGAKHVVALDVGHAQLHPSLRDRSEVTNLEGVNATGLSPQWWLEQDLPNPITVVVVDLSFISLTRVLSALVETFGVHSHYVFLVKPQFEVGPSGLSQGVVKDVSRREAAVMSVVTAVEDHGLTIGGLIASPVTGEAGNVEYLVYASATPSVHEAEWDRRIPRPTQ